MRYLLFPVVTLMLLACTKISMAQDFNNPGEYMSAINNAHVEMNKRYMAYMSAAAHIHRKRKIEKMRVQTLESIEKSLGQTGELPYYKGDNSLRKSSMDYIKFCYSIFNEDYSKIVNTEEIAEQSYDAMQAFLLLEEKTDEKIKQANEQMIEAGKAFAAKYNVKLINEKDELDEKMNEASKLTGYTNKIYLIFFKCYWEDGEIVKAMNIEKLTSVEQGRSSLIRYADEGLQALASDGLRNFAGDPALANSCKLILNFYKRTAEKDLPKLMDFFLKKDNFDKMKKAFSAKASPSKSDVDAYNAAVRDLNSASEAFNSLNTMVNNSRNDALKDWNDTEKSFADSHMPYYK